MTETTIPEQVHDTMSLELASRGDETTDDEGERQPLLQIKKFTNYSKLSVVQGSFFVVGDVIGLGLVVLPHATMSLGWSSAVILPVVGLLLTYTSVVLANNWLLLKIRFPEKYAVRYTRNPFACVGFESFGRAGRITVQLALHFTILMDGIVLLILLADNSKLLLHELDVEVSSCVLMLVAYVVLVPCSWLGTAKDTWGLAVIGTASASLAYILMIIQLFMDYPSQKETKESKMKSGIQSDVNAHTVMLGIAVFVFVCTSHGITLNVQQDMKDQWKFNRSLVFGYIVVIAFYIPISLGSYHIYGNAITANLMDAMSPTPYRTYIILLIGINVFVHFLYNTNTTFLEIENALGIGLDFNWKRAAIRTMIILGILFFAESAPYLDHLVHLCSSITYPLISIVFPCAFSAKLKLDVGPRSWDILLNSFIAVFGFALGLSATYASVSNFVLDLGTPCYLRFSFTNSST